MAGYAAELQAQIAEKEKRRKLQRQESLRQSQHLLAQRMTVPSGLVCLPVHHSMSNSALLQQLHHARRSCHTCQCTACIVKRCSVPVTCHP